MTKRLLHTIRRFAASFDKLTRRFTPEGRLASFGRGALFVGVASTIGLYSALVLFVPESVVMNYLNTLLAHQGLSVTAEDLDYSPFIAVTLDDVAIRDSQGKTLLTVGSLKLSPRLLPLLRGTLAATATFTDINGNGGRLTVRYDPGDDPCISFKGRDVSLDPLRLLFPTIELEGTLNGEAEFCEEKGKVVGEVNTTVRGAKLGGTVYGLTLEKPVELGEIVVTGTAKEGKLEVEKVNIEGAFAVEVTGKVTLNSQNYQNSRLELFVTIQEKKSGAMQELPILDLALARFKNPEGGYALKICLLYTSPSPRDS